MPAMPHIQVSFVVGCRGLPAPAGVLGQRPDLTVFVAFATTSAKGTRMRPDGQGGRLLGIQLARGAAAVLVVLYHAGRGLALPQYLGHVPLGGLFNFGHAGIDFFFVLSGFIIFTVHHGDIGRPSALPRYVWRRLARIYPIYWVVTAIVIALALFK